MTKLLALALPFVISGCALLQSPEAETASNAVDVFCALRMSKLVVVQQVAAERGIDTGLLAEQLCNYKPVYDAFVEANKQRAARPEIKALGAAMDAGLL